MSTRVSVAVRDPAAVGVKLILIWQLEDKDSVLPQPFAEMAKSLTFVPLRLTDVKFTGSPPRL